MKFFLASLFHESNTFSPIPTSRESFERAHWYRPSGSYAPPATVELLGYGAFARAALERRVELAPSLFAWTEPSRPLDAASYASLKEEILEDLRRALPVDGVFLFLHGAQMAQGTPDCAGDLISACRAIVGPDVPIAVEYDLHANLSAAALQGADCLLACKEYPHTDFADVAVQSLELLLRTVGSEVRPVMAAWRVPVIGLYPTGVPPVSDFVARLRAAERLTGVLGASCLHGFFGADHSEACAAVVVITDKDADLADQTAERLALDFLETARAAGISSTTVERALEEARSSAGPVVLADRSDNPGGGAAGDSTWVLKKLLEGGFSNAAVALLWDPVAVDLAHLAGEGARIPLRIGGKIGPLSGPPVDLEVEVLAVRSDVKQAAFGVGEPRIPLGRSAAVRAGGIDIVLNARRQQVFSPHCFTAHGIEPERKALIVVKSTQHFHKAFASLARKVIYCDAPGTVTLDLKTLPYRHLRRPIYPLDTQAPLHAERFPFT